MIGLDTNVVVRYITLDDPVQVPAAVAMMDSFSADEPGFISLIVVAELARVLEVSIISTRLPSYKFLKRCYKAER